MGSSAPKSYGKEQTTSNYRFQHLCRTHLFLHPKAGLRRNKFWRETMESDVLVMDFQDGCPPEERHHVVRSFIIFYSTKCFSIDVTRPNAAFEHHSCIALEIEAHLLFYSR